MDTNTYKTSNGLSGSIYCILLHSRQRVLLHSRQCVLPHSGSAYYHTAGSPDNRTAPKQHSAASWPHKVPMMVTTLPLGTLSEKLRGKNYKPRPRGKTHNNSRMPGEWRLVCSLRMPGDWYAVNWICSSDWFLFVMPSKYLISFRETVRLIKYSWV